MEDRETARMRKYGESKTTRIMMATVPHVTFGSGLRKFQADGSLLTRVYSRYPVFVFGLLAHPNHLRDPPRWKIRALKVKSNRVCLVMAGGITTVCTDTWKGIQGTCKYRLTLRLLMSYIYIYIYGAPSKARSANVVYIWTYVWQRLNSLFLFAAQCFNTESMQRGFLCHICV